MLSREEEIIKDARYSPFFITPKYFRPRFNFFSTRCASILIENKRFSIQTIDLMRNSKQFIHKYGHFIIQLFSFVLDYVLNDKCSTYLLDFSNDTIWHWLFFTFLLSN